MFEVTTSRDIAAPKERVWAVLTDIDRAAEVIGQITSIERINGGSGFDVGTRWRESFNVAGREGRQTQLVTAIDPGRSFTLATSNKRSRYTETITVEDLREGTRVTFDFVTVPNSAFGAFGGATVGRMFRGTTRRMLDEFLNDVARAAEAT